MVKKELSITCNCGHRFYSTDDAPICPKCQSKPTFGWKTNCIGNKVVKTDAEKASVFDRLVEYWERKGHDIYWYNGCAEPGYDDQTVVTANWNPAPMKRISDFIERYFDNVSIEWSDEWTSCGECGKAIRTSPDSYGWQAYYIMGDCEITCLDCVKDDVESYLDDYLNSINRAIPSELIDDVKKIGFECYQECMKYESGFHPGQNDTPQDAIKDIEKQLGADYFAGHYDYLFAITDVGQFDMSFTILVREKDEE
jgi:hypothetical protein